MGLTGIRGRQDLSHGGCSSWWEGHATKVSAIARHAVKVGSRPRLAQRVAEAASGDKEDVATRKQATMPQRHFPTMESPKTAERKSDLTTGSSLNVDRDKAQFHCRATRRPRHGTCDGKLTMLFFRQGRASGGNTNRVWLESACLVDIPLPGWEWKAVFVSLEGAFVMRTRILPPAMSGCRHPDRRPTLRSRGRTP